MQISEVLKVLADNSSEITHVIHVTDPHDAANLLIISSQLQGITVILMVIPQAL